VKVPPNPTLQPKANGLPSLGLHFILAQSRQQSATYTYGTMRNSIPFTLLSWVVLVWLVLEFVTMLINEKRRALHDYIAGTVVVSDA
jgi:hypothetical protein